jgi:hypothetical protein
VVGRRADSESLLVDAREAEVVVFRRWEEFHEKASAD